jgi:hypothetical protein
MTRESMGRIEVNQLQELGFSEDLINEAVEREASGVLDISPPADLLERTIAQCAALFPNLDSTSQESLSWWTALGNWLSHLFFPGDSAPEPDQGLAPQWASLKATFEDVLSSGDTSRLPALVQTARAIQPSPAAMLPLHFAGALGFALEKHQRPLLILENHNLIEPRWWHTDEDFRRVRAACQWLNREVASKGIAPSARVVVLRPEVSLYSPEDLEVFRHLLQETMSDVWLLPFSRAGEYASQDIAVIGDREVFRMDRKVSTPQEAWATAELVENPGFASTMRTSLEQILDHAHEIKRGGELVVASFSIELRSREGIQSILQQVIRAPGIAGPAAHLIHR